MTKPGSGPFTNGRARFPGSGFDAVCGSGFVEKTIENKRRKGLL